ncbi:histidine phosphatase superfamily [Mycena sp. CBHHK59/15]|nr:histidine phosphatase superfamily [Mycena sp. CBHHK59/15]
MGQRPLGLGPHTLEETTALFDGKATAQIGVMKDAGTAAPFARVYLVRHGETQANREGVIQGQLDTALNAAGVRQAGRLADALRCAGVKFDVAYSSDLGRALETARIILGHRGDVEIVEQAELRERFMGDLQGKKANHEVRFAPGVQGTLETTGAFAARAVKWWKRAILQRTLALPHATTGPRTTGKARCVEGVVVGTGCANASVTIVEVGRDRRGVIVLYGGVEHLVGGEGEGEVMVEGNVDVDVDEGVVGEEVDK